MSEWKKVSSLKAGDITWLGERLPGYSYQDAHRSHRTDELVCDYIVKKVRALKKQLFEIIHVTYELHRDKPLTKHYENMRDALDIFSDEVKVRTRGLDRGLEARWLREIISRDRDILNLLNNLESRFEVVRKAFLEVDRKRNWSELKKDTLKLSKDVVRLTVLFREREAACQIKRLSLERTFDKIRDKLEKGF